MMDRYNQEDQTPETLEMGEQEDQPEVEDTSLVESASETEVQDVVGEPAQPEDDRAWYVVHCYSGY